MNFVGIELFFTQLDELSLCSYFRISGTVNSALFKTCGKEKKGRENIYERK